MGLIFIAALNILQSIQFFVGRIIQEIQIAETDLEEMPGFESWHSREVLTTEVFQMAMAILLIAFAGRIGTFLYNLHSQPDPVPSEDSST